MKEVMEKKNSNIQTHPVFDGSVSHIWILWSHRNPNLHTQTALA